MPSHNKKRLNEDDADDKDDKDNEDDEDDRTKYKQLKYHCVSFTSGRLDILAKDQWIKLKVVYIYLKKNIIKRVI